MKQKRITDNKPTVNKGNFTKLKQLTVSLSLLMTVAVLLGAFVPAHAAAGDPTVKEDLLKGKTIGDMTYKVHLDGYNLMLFLKGEGAESPRHEFIYWTDEGSVAALRYNN